MVESVLVMLSPAFCDFGWCVAQAAVRIIRAMEKQSSVPDGMQTLVVSFQDKSAVGSTLVVRQCSSGECSICESSVCPSVARHNLHDSRLARDHSAMKWWRLVLALVQGKRTGFTKL